MSVSCGSRVNLRYLVEIDGDAEALKHLPELFRGTDFSITGAADGRVFVSGTSFEACANASEVIEVASRVLRWVGSILEVYAGAADEFTVKNVFWIDDRGHLMQRLIMSDKIRFLGDFKDLAACLQSNTTLGSELLRLATDDDRIARAFDLIGSKTIGWYEIYDLIDLMGGVRGLVKQGWVTRKEVSSIRQTATHYRHLGSISKQYELPDNPPHLNAARATITNIVRRWISERLKQHGLGETRKK
ncbi:MAG: hypothetical protein ACREX9_05390 [Gammaproteobacteria bacterium]